MLCKSSWHNVYIIGNHMLQSFGMIVGLIIQNCWLQHWLKVSTHTCWNYWKGTWTICIHSTVDLKPWNPYSFALQTMGSSFVLAQLRSRGHERPVTTFNIWHFSYKYYAMTVEESCLWFWSFWVLNCSLRVCIGFSLSLEGWACL